VRCYSFSLTHISRARFQRNGEYRLWVGSSNSLASWCVGLAVSGFLLTFPSQKTKLSGCYHRDSDFCFLDDTTEGEYVDLSLNPEQYTGYAGPSAAKVWRSIYEENCFGLSKMNLMTGTSSAPVSLPDSMLNAFKDADSETETGASGECLEKRVYYKIVSGGRCSKNFFRVFFWMSLTVAHW
jgi:ERO1-like protein beta